jgi:hypothetical protein
MLSAAVAQDCGLGCSMLMTASRSLNRPAGAATVNLPGSAIRSVRATEPAGSALPRSGAHRQGRTSGRSARTVTVRHRISPTVCQCRFTEVMARGDRRIATAQGDREIRITLEADAAGGRTDQHRRKHLARKP